MKRAWTPISYGWPSRTFGSRDDKLPGLSLSLWAQYYLDNFATVAEAVAATEKGGFQLVPITVGIREKMSSTVHLSLADKSGDSAIIEYIGGKPKIYHGRQYTVMTNSPTFDQQLELARKYKGLGGDQPLPGTSEAQDRFVRASYYLKYLPTGGLPPGGGRNAQRDAQRFGSVWHQRAGKTQYLGDDFPYRRRPDQRRVFL